jgi:hypothetical protein
MGSERFIGLDGTICARAKGGEEWVLETMKVLI